MSMKKILNKMKVVKMRIYGQQHRLFTPNLIPLSYALQLHVLYIPIYVTRINLCFPVQLRF